MKARFFTEDFRGNRVEHVMDCTGAEYAQSVMDEKDCRRLTLETEKNYYTTDGIEKEYAAAVLDAAYNGGNIMIPEDHIFEVNAKDSV